MKKKSNELFPFGDFLKEMRERKKVSLKKVEEATGISNAYLSLLETGERRKLPSPDRLKTLANYYNVSVQQLLEKAGYFNENEIEETYEQKIEKAFLHVISDLTFKFGTRLKDKYDLDGKRFIVEMYDTLKGKDFLYKKINNAITAKTKILTIDGFCDHIIQKGEVYYLAEDLFDGLNYKSLNVENLADAFVEYFQLEYPLAIEQLTLICSNSYIQIKWLSDDYKAYEDNISYEQGSRIYLNQNDPLSGKLHILLHDLYKIIGQKISQHSASKYKREENELEDRMDCFAACVHVHSSFIRALQDFLHRLSRQNFLTSDLKQTT